jgi:ethanolamine utilization protein EutA
MPAAYAETLAEAKLQHYHPDPDHTPDGHHVDPDYQGPIEEHPLWQRDNVILNSVGIDIGSAGTQILFSRVHLQRQAVDLSTRYLVVERTTLFESPVSLTPYESETRIDARALGEIVDQAYHDARLHPDDIDTGVVILTGEALRRENSERIARILAEKCGALVCATAGHHMEAMLAAYGSGAAQMSHDRAERVLNIDIGGGTTKLSVIDNGQILSTAAIHVGGRLLAMDENHKLERIDPAGRTHAARAGFDWRLGDTIADDELQSVAESMADDIVAALTGELSAADKEDLYLTDPIEQLDGVQSIVCSGGVAEYVYAREHREFGDLGKKLGQALRARIDTGSLPWQLLPDSQGIRSTALGCSEFTAQLSGNTGYISNPDLLLPL